MSAIHLTLDEEQWVKSVYESLTLEQKVGQLFCPIMMENTLSAVEQIDEYALRIRHEVEAFAPGGYYLNRYYLPTTPALLNRLQDISKVPLLIGADMESGAGSGFGGVIAHGLVTFPPAMGIGATGSECCAYQVGRSTAWQARAIGVNFIFAPSLDVNSNPDNPIINIRSFGEDAELVSRLGCAYIRGVQDGGAIASAKHFPGHGDTSKDSHLELEILSADRDRLDRVELVPFRKAIEEAGVLAVMTGHLAVPSLEPDIRCPATLSKRILQDLLRNELGFDGLIVTDALLMGGITTLYEPGEAAIRAIQAGADWLLMPPDFPLAYHAVLKAIQSGIISEERLDESVIRILAIKSKCSLHLNERVDLESLRNLNEINSFPNRISYAACDNAITLVKNEKGLLPLSGMDSMAVLMLSDTDDEFYDDGYAFFQEINSRSLNVSEFISIVPGADVSQIVSAQKTVEKSDVILFGLYVTVLPEKDSIELLPEYIKLIEKAIDSGKSVVVISFGNPYLLRRFPRVQAYLCAYGYFYPMVASVGETIFGERPPHGKLSVQIKDICDAGTGLSF